jgi:membrane protein implicated in regulation of membrane protease activity
MLQFTIDPNQTDSKAVRKMLEAHVVRERMASAKSVSLHLMAALSVIVWLGAKWPGLMPTRLLDAALAVWAAILFFSILAAVEEWLWHKKAKRYQYEQQENHWKA